ncbi:MAG TPA: bifunctional phosphoribosyl-AMP cyclohydrolase/phosphoribosyl-ATP diphosphatase HisIE [Luteimonas sp.]|nr:bifunctional phosphoribosyl-AMP cyclohydrolase/phosphoribosyl-ATP diphosphatase HisIE [Luteimonas sp.]
MSAPRTATIDIDALAWARQDGLLPAIVQDAATLRVLMLGYMDREALAATLEGGRVTFYSRSRRRQWCKGETSGHWLELVSIEADCDGDALLVMARAHGPTCHLGRCSCFAHAPGDPVGALDALVAARIAAPSIGYTDRLLASGIARIAQKVGEEGVETALAAVAGEQAALRGEAADLVYHLVVALRARGLSLDDLRGELARRAGPGDN